MKKILFTLLILTCLAQAGLVYAQDTEKESEEIRYTLISSGEIGHVNELLRSGINQLSSNVKETYLEYNSPEAREYIEKLDIAYLPYVIYDNSIAFTDLFFHMVRNNMIEKEAGHYVIPDKQLRMGEIMLFKRERDPNSLSIYGMGFCPYSKSATADLIDFIRQNKSDIKLKFKYLVRLSEFGISSPHGPEEIRENIRQIIIQKYYPDKLYDYLLLTQKKKPEDALEELSISQEDIDSKKQDAISILKEQNKETEVLNIHRSPTFLWENIFLISTREGLGNHKSFNVKKNKQTNLKP